MKHTIGFALAMIVSSVSLCVSAATYTLDPTHSFINFKISHLGYSWLLGRFNSISGEMTFDPNNLHASGVAVLIDTTSYDSNHSERNIHIKGKDYLDVKKFPEAKFTSTAYSGDAQSGTLTGSLTLHGVTKEIQFNIKKIGEGDDPWGGYRAGFEGTVTILRTDYGMESNLGPLANEVYLELFIEGVRN
jgi:polyisoprenoid-binding protein YceI